MSRNARKDKIIDWESIEYEYRLGIKSLQAIGEIYGVSAPAICTYGKRHKWKRDLTKKVQQSTKTKLTTKSVNEQKVNEQKVNEQKVNKREEQEKVLEQERILIEKASNVAVEIILKHRQKIDNYQRLFDKAAEFMEKEEVTKDNYFTWTRAMNTGIDALGKAIKLERQAYNMEDNANNQEITGILDLIENETMAVTREEES